MLNRPKKLKTFLWSSDSKGLTLESENIKQSKAFILIKKLLKNNNTNIYNNPVVITNGNIKGKAIKGEDLDIKNYNKIFIKNIINKLKNYLKMISF